MSLILTPARARITAAWTRDEAEAMAALLPQAALSPEVRQRVLARATALVTRVRAQAGHRRAVESFMRAHDLSSEEGVLLMCVAEALLRIPDDATADRLIRDKLGGADWRRHLGADTSMLVNASTWGLILTGRLVQLAEDTRNDALGALRRLVGRAGEPVIRRAVREAMRLLGEQFVMGRSMAEALDRAAGHEHARYRHSYDMLGEAALTRADAARYYAAYADAIAALGARGPWPDVCDAPSISIKLSALHPRYETTQRARVDTELTPKVLALARLAMASGIGMTIDAEEADRLDLSLDIAGAVFPDPALAGWHGFGLAVQAYQKRAPFVIEWLIETARATGRRWLVRLVKGAYWDTEIKRAQEQGLAGYPVFTRKPHTDVSYLACAKQLFAAGSGLVYPQFATHNAYTIAAIDALAEGRAFEFQRLHGMGSDLYDDIVGGDGAGVPCRVYAPVGAHAALLPYLVRRLLENGANTSFVNRIADETVPLDELLADPCAAVRASGGKPHPKIPLPGALYGGTRRNSSGVNLANDDDLAALASAIDAARKPWSAVPRVPGALSANAPRPVTNPADRRDTIGVSTAADAATLERSLANAVAAQEAWDATPVAQRAALLERTADLIEAQRGELVALCVREAGKTVPAALAEVREATDLCRYYAAMARTLFGEPMTLPGPTGETNRLGLRGRGVFVCISPWNFPLAIYTGQIAAALVAGNPVIAKPAEQTTLIGAAAVALLHAAGIPESVLQFVPCKGSVLGSTLLARHDVAGVCFTGSTATAWTINRTLAARDAPIAALIAETGGLNVLIADSTALPEQLVKDVLASAFESAGQRCSAARVLCVQEDIADDVITMLAGALDELVVGDPALLSSDVGPVIDEASRRDLDAHAARMARVAKCIGSARRTPGTTHGSFFMPQVYEIPSLDLLTHEVFGPVLHVLRWKAGSLDELIDAVNATGYGLTLGLHSRIDATIAHVARRAKVGNIYVNRNQIGAVVGVQPFGGERLSGTGPKAGGPHYLLRFATERTLTINTAAAGGNAALLTLGE